MNKTPISYSTNREIGGVAPGKYLDKIAQKGQVAVPVLDSYLESHWLNVTACRTDNFDMHIIERAKKLLDAIESAMGKAISGRDSQDVVDNYDKNFLR